ncbi:MAG TPA: tetratricopeptide repeat protein [Aggregatilineales bacterium]|nr:tetratricopeptide repeat protein [Aggregatilineales bacterium]
MSKLSKRLGLNRYDADVEYKLSIQHYLKRQLTDAILAVEKAIKLLPENSEYVATRGFYYLEDGAEKEAKRDFEKALELFAYEVLAHIGLGTLAYRNSKWDSALEHFTHAYHANPKRAETLYYLALCHHRKLNNKEALDWMTKALALMESGNDKRKGDAQKWVKQFEKMVMGNS